MTEDMGSAEGSGQTVVAAFIGHQTLGNFLMCHIGAASVARQFANGRLVVIYRDDRPYKNLLNQLNPYVAATFRLPRDPKVVAPLDWIDARAHLGNPFQEVLAQKGLHEPDIFLTPSMLGGGDEGMFLEPVPVFRVPDDIAAPAGARLIARGLDPERWFVVLHVREAGYMYRAIAHKYVNDPDSYAAATVRDADPMTYVPMIEEIVRNQGGQVVRVGDTSMTPLPEMDGLIDLAVRPDTFDEQVFAISRARFLVGTTSGPLALACAFQTPAVQTNCLGVGVWNDGDAVLLKTVTTAEGYRLTPREVADVPGELPCWFTGVTYENNSAEQLVAAAMHMARATDGVRGWRVPAGEPPYASPGHVDLPLPKRNKSVHRGITWLE